MDMVSVHLRGQLHPLFFQHAAPPSGTSRFLEIPINRMKLRGENKKQKTKNDGDGKCDSLSHASLESSLKSINRRPVCFVVGSVLGSEM